MADAHSRCRHEAAAYVAGQLGVDLVTATLALAEDEGDGIDLDEIGRDGEQRERLTRMNTLPALDDRVLCLRQITHHAAMTAERIGRHLGWTSADARRVLRSYWMSTSGDGGGFAAWLKKLACDLEAEAE